jgi:hypothetical protein
VAVNLVGGLQLAVDAAVPLFEAARVPGNVEVKQVVAMGLEIQTFPGGVVTKKDAERVFRGTLVEGQFDGLSLVARRRAMEDGNSLSRVVRAGGGIFQASAEVPEGVLVFGENDDPLIIPLITIEKILSDPPCEIAHPAIRLHSGRIGRDHHFLEKRLLLCRGVVAAGSSPRHLFDLGVFQSREFLLREFRTVVIGVDALFEQVGRARPLHVERRFLLRPDPRHRFGSEWFWFIVFSQGRGRTG